MRRAERRDVRTSGISLALRGGSPMQRGEKNFRSATILLQMDRQTQAQFSITAYEIFLYGAISDPRRQHGNLHRSSFYLPWLAGR